MDSKQKLRKGAPMESGENLFRDMMVLDDVISVTEKEARVAGKDVRRARWKGKGIYRFSVIRGASCRAR